MEDEREKQSARSATNLELRCPSVRPFVLRSVCGDQSDAEVEVVVGRRGRKKRDRLSRSLSRSTYKAAIKSRSQGREGRGIGFRTTRGAELNVFAGLRETVLSHSMGGMNVLNLEKVSMYFTSNKIGKSAINANFHQRNF